MQPLIQGKSSADASSILQTQENQAAFAAVQNGQTTSSGLLFAEIAAGMVHPPFFNGEVALEGSAYYQQLPNGNIFGYYNYLSPDSDYIYHYDMGFEYWFDAADRHGGIYLYDFASNTFFYTSRDYPFPYLYDFTLNATLYYYPDSANPGRYTSNPRYFYDFAHVEDHHEVTGRPRAFPVLLEHLQRPVALLRVVEHRRGIILLPAASPSLAAHGDGREARRAAPAPTP